MERVSISGWLLCDEGLGALSGVELIRGVRRRVPQIGTVMLTGESETRETHRVADLYYEKPVRSDI